jgi:signal transduction histidine kinase
MKLNVINHIDEKVLIDMQKITLVLRNIVCNAIVHGIASTTIDLSLAIKGNELIITCTNIGKAPSVEYDAEVFTRFDDAHTSHGLGIGLSIVREICEQFYGAVHYKVDDDAITFTATVSLANKENSSTHDAVTFEFDDLDDVIEL